MDNEVFYIVVGRGYDVTVACAQWFDLPDYDLVVDKHFETEADARGLQLEYLLEQGLLKI